MLNSVQKFQLIKVANAYNLQQFMPIQERRELSPEEQGDIELAQQKILPKIFKSKADPITEDMSSPGWAAAAGAIPGGLLGYVLAALLGNKNNPGLSKVLGTLGGASLGGLVGYKGRQASNNTLEEYMRTLPKNQTTRRMMEADPVYSREQQQREQMRMLQMLASQR